MKSKKIIFNPFYLLVPFIIAFMICANTHIIKMDEENEVIDFPSSAEYGNLWLCDEYFDELNNEYYQFVRVEDPDNEIKTVSTEFVDEEYASEENASYGTYIAFCMKASDREKIDFCDGKNYPISYWKGEPQVINLSSEFFKKHEYRKQELAASRDYCDSISDILDDELYYSNGDTDGGYLHSSTIKEYYNIQKNLKVYDIKAYLGSKDEKKSDFEQFTKVVKKGIVFTIVTIGSLLVIFILIKVGNYYKRKKLKEYEMLYGKKNVSSRKSDSSDRISNTSRIDANKRANIKKNNVNDDLDTIIDNKNTSITKDNSSNKNQKDNINKKDNIKNRESSNKDRNKEKVIADSNKNTTNNTTNNKNNKGSNTKGNITSSNKNNNTNKNNNNKNNSNKNSSNKSKNGNKGSNSSRKKRR